MTDTNEHVLSVGDVITTDSVLPEGHTAGNQIVWVDADGSRRVIETDVALPPTFPGNIPELLARHPDNDLIYWTERASIAAGQYLPYPFEGMTRLQSYSDYPVNQIPYILHLREHVGQVAGEFVDVPAHDAFAHETQLTGFSPTAVTLTTGQAEKFELLTKNIRRLIGVVWQKIDIAAGLDPEDESNWKRGLRAVWPQVVELCDTCSGRGWKRKLLRTMDVAGWKGRFHANQGGSFFVRPDGTVGGNATSDANQLTGAIPAFVRALQYQEDTQGDEDSHDVQMEWIQTDFTG